MADGCTGHRVAYFIETNRMRNRWLIAVMFVVMVLTVASCNVTRSLPEGDYLLSRVKFEDDKTTPREERITPDRDDLEAYVRQSPNKRIFGIDFYVWVYQKANPEKTNWWNNFIRKKRDFFDYSH